jgi:adenosylmethionine-8-amino-7-oxononanoate aminotransferase
MSVCDPDTGMHHLFAGYLPRQLFAPAPPAGYDTPVTDADLDAVRALLAAHSDEVAAVILEPVVQGTGGMRFYPPAWLARLRTLCDEAGVLLILDEIATGFGRSGELFGCYHAGVSPDVMCLGKAMTGGYMTMAATLCTDEVASGVCAVDGGALMHGPTFMANPLAASVSLASIELLLAGPWQKRIEAISGWLRRGLAPARDVPGVADVRVLGAIGVVELEEPCDMRVLQPRMVERGVWVRPFGRLVYVMPPYVIDEDDTATLTAALVDAITVPR